MFSIFACCNKSGDVDSTVTIDESTMEKPQKENVTINVEEKADKQNKEPITEKKEPKVKEVVTETVETKRKPEIQKNKITQESCENILMSIINDDSQGK